jgi:hypothetical protein
MVGMDTTMQAATGGKSGYLAGACVAAALVTTETLAERYELSTRQVQKMAAAGIFPTVKIGRRCLRFPVAACDAALEKFQTRAASTGRAGRRASR